MVVQIWLQRHPGIPSVSVRFDMDNMKSVQCVQRQGTAQSDPLLALSEDIFAEASHRTFSLSAKYVLLRESDWADGLSNFQETSVAWLALSYGYGRLNCCY